MPYLNVKIVAPASKETAAKVASLLSDLTASMLGKKPELTAIAVEFMQPEFWFIGGVPVSTSGVSTFYLDIKITEGTNTKNEKAAYVKQVFAGMEAILGGVASASYIVIDEVHADAWGYQGETQEFRYIKGKSL